MTLPLSILDLALIGRGETARDALEGSVRLARLAEARGYRRVWYAEHHNMTAIASSSPAVLIAHVAAHTRSIRLGAGGVMLPNHAPLVIAEQFGTLATLHPGRIDLGLGRAPGSDQLTMRAMRRNPASADTFPQDVVELQGYLTGQSRVPGVKATPGDGTNVPLYILGSSLFGAQLAAALGLPFGFASHFAPDALEEAVAIYRERFRPSPAHEQPYVIAGINVLAAETGQEAHRLLERVQRARVSLFVGRGREIPDEEAAQILHSPQGRFILEMMRYTALGTPAEVRSQLERFAAHARADELMLAHAAPSIDTRLRSIELTADAFEMVAAAA